MEPSRVLSQSSRNRSNHQRTAPAIALELTCVSLDLAYLDGRVKVFSIGSEVKTIHLPHSMVVTGIPASLPLILDSTEESPEILVEEPSSDEGLSVIHEMPDLDGLLLEAPLQTTLEFPHLGDGE